VALVLSFIGLGALGRVAIVKGALATLAGAPVFVLTVTAAILTAIILRRRRRLASDRHLDWLAALPSDLSLTARAAVAPLAIWGGVVLIAVAAAIAANLALSAPAILVLASTGGYCAAIALVVLDPASARSLKRHLRTLVETRHASILLATHALDVVERYADRAVLMLSGRNVQVWSAEEISAIRKSEDGLEEAISAAAAAHS
jgi:ABC-type branched-subunit amino acid transport system ATPase component